MTTMKITSTHIALHSKTSVIFEDRLTLVSFPLALTYVLSLSDFLHLSDKLCLESRFEPFSPETTPQGVSSLVETSLLTLI